MTDYTPLLAFILIATVVFTAYLALTGAEAEDEERDDLERSIRGEER